METLESLSKRIATTKDLQSVVRTMKALSAVSIRQYEQAVAALHQYNRAIELGFQIALCNQALPSGDADESKGQTAVIVFGTDRGLCGRFNEQVARFAVESLEASCAAQGDILWLVVGARAAARLEAMGQRVDERLALPGAVGRLTSSAHAILLKLDQWRIERDLVRALVIHNHRSEGATASPRTRQLLPLDIDWLADLKARPWPSRRLPTFTMPNDSLFASLVREHLFVTLYRAGAESMASEHSTRLAAMQAAEHNISERLDEMYAAFRHLRQQSITEELMDVVAGFEASRSSEAPDA